MTDDSPVPRTRPDGALPDRLAPRGPGPDGALQLGVRAPPRRHVRLPHRGHRRRAQHPGVLRRPVRGDGLARPRLGRGSRRRRPARAVPPERAVRDLRRRPRPPREVLAHLRVLLHQRGGRGPPQGLRLQDHGVRRPLPRALRGAARRLPERGTRTRRALPDARRRDHLRRPRPWRDHLPHRPRPGLRAGAGQRPAALHAGQPGRRRADGDHPRAPRRGPALQHPSADRPLPGARGGRDRQGDPALRAPSLRDGRGQQEALEA